MRESPSSASGDSCIRRNDSNKEFLHKLIRRNDSLQVGNDITLCKRGTYLNLPLPSFAKSGF
ncbi:MAG: hypothetical protein NT007_18235 [Candidatus Kapabacteria bacterium]|nr:hypothetical protein [Candidatus Kapabacteria bacterium]